MDIDRLISSRPHNATIGLFGEATENNDRIALLQIRRGDGQIWFFDKREDAIAVAECWVSTGRPQVRESVQ